MREFTSLRFALVCAIWLLGLSGVAAAADPACNLDPPTAGATDPITGDPVEWSSVIDATSGGFFYCTPQIDQFGANYPLTGYPMTCEVRWLTVVLDSRSSLAPGEYVEVAGLTLHWNVDPVSIACSNAKGEGVAFVRPALFPAALPGSPYVSDP